MSAQVKWTELGFTVFGLLLVVRSSEMHKFLRSFVRLGFWVKCFKEFATETKVLVSAYVVNFVVTY